MAISLPHPVFERTHVKWFGSLGANLRAVAVFGAFMLCVSATALVVLALTSPVSRAWLEVMLGLPLIMFPIAPVMVMALRRKSLALGAYFIFAPILAWVLLTVIALGRPSLVVPGALGLYFVTCIVCGFFLPNVWPRAAGAESTHAHGDAISCPHCGQQFVPSSGCDGFAAEKKA